MQPTVHIVILAAGASSRMLGRDKLLEPVAGCPILRHVAETAIGTGCPVVVMLPPASPRHLVLDNLPVTPVDVPDANLGMSRSLSRAATLLSHDVPTDAPDGLMVLPADMPGFTIGALTAMVAAFRNAPALILRATDASGKPGHPAIFPRDLWPELAALAGDEGGRSVLRRHQARLRLTPLPGDMATLDLDTPADWAAYRASGR
jgi:CTP:molybdopterin cytidylyltransferase MocA